MLLQQQQEQEKFMQDMMSLSQFAAAGFPANPFGPFGFPHLPPPPAAASSSSSSKNHKSSKQQRERSQSPVNERSVSPASSVASNRSTQPQPDFSVFLNNLMGFGAGGGAPTSGLPPMPPLLGTDLSKLPVELLAALSAQSGAGAFDPAMFSALAQLHSQALNGETDDNHDMASAAPPSSSSSSTRTSSHKSSSSSSKFQPASSSSSNKSSKPSSSGFKPQASSSHHLATSSGGPKVAKPSSASSRAPLQDPDEGDEYEGLDLSIRKPSSSIMNKPLQKPSASIMSSSKHKK